MHHSCLSDHVQRPSSFPSTPARPRSSSVCLKKRRPKTLSIRGQSEEEVVEYFARLGWQVKSAEQVSFDSPPNSWWIFTPDGHLPSSWFGYAQFEQLVEDWYQNGPVHMHWNFVRQTFENLYCRADERGRSEILQWVEQGGRYPDAISCALANWQCPRDWLEQVVALAPQSFFLRPGGGEIDRLRGELSGFITEFERAQLSGKIPGAEVAFRGRKRL